MNPDSLCPVHLTDEGERTFHASPGAQGRAIAGRSFQFKTKPWQHQLDALDMIMREPATMLAYDMGTGKSKIVVDAVCALGLMRTLVVCPKSVCDVWPAEFEKHGNGQQRILKLAAGATARRAKELKQVFAVTKSLNQPIVVIVNYDAAWRSELGKAIKPLRWSLIVADEIHKIKSPGGKASWFLASLRGRSDKRIGLTGTPLPHSPLDAYAQYRFLDPTIFGTSFTRFRATYAVMGGYENHQVVGYRKMDEFNKRFYSIARRVTKDEVLDLPAAIHEKRYVDLSSESKRVYTDIKDHLIADVDAGVVTATNAMVRLLRLQQVTSGFTKTENEVIQVLGDAKKRAQMELFEDIGAAEPIVCFGTFHEELNQIKAAALQMNRPAFELSGRCNELNGWLRAKGGNVLAVQIKAGGVGIDLSKSCYAVYWSTGFSLGDYEQSLARMHRPGQTRSVTYTHLLARATIDIYVHAALRKRKQVVEYALEGVVHEN